MFLASFINVLNISGMFLCFYITLVFFWCILYNIIMTQVNNDDTAFDSHDNEGNYTFLFAKTKILNAIKFICEQKKRAYLEDIFDHLAETESSNVDKELIQTNDKQEHPRCSWFVSFKDGNSKWLSNRCSWRKSTWAWQFFDSRK